MKSNTWKPIRLEEVIDINPRTTLKRGTLAKKIAMEHVKEFTRKIDGFEISDFKSGSKFKNDDTLFARITPCLENGKTAFVDVLNDSEVAFGSTEFFVLRAKKGHSDPKYIYYLSISAEFRNTAIQSMTGTSGRQRAQRESLLEYEINLPSLKEQKEIGETLSLLDEKIELNNSIISNLEELAQTLFKHWFVDFEFPNKNGEPYKSSGGKMVESELGMIPKDWKVNDFDKIINIGSGKRPKVREEMESEEFNIPVLGASKIMGYSDEFLFNEPIIVIGRVGTHGVIQRIVTASWPSDNAFVLRSDYMEFLYQYLKTINYTSLNRGSTQPLLTQRDIKGLKFALAPTEIMHDFENQQSKFSDIIFQRKNENEILTELRDTLLPKLLSGEIEIPQTKEVIDDVPVS